MTLIPARLSAVVELARAGELYCLPTDDLIRAVRDAHALTEAIHAESLRRDVAAAEPDVTVAPRRVRGGGGPPDSEPQGQREKQSVEEPLG